MTNGQRTCLLGALLTAVVFHSAAQTHPPPEPQTSSAQQQLPDSPGKETVLKLCGSCHSANIVLGRGKTREEWGEVVASMISRGAKGTQAEFGQVVDYLARNLPPKVAPGASKTSRRRGGGGGLSAGPDEKQVVDPVIAAQGKSLYDTRCVACHGPKARGTENGPDLVRSLIVMHDRYGSTVGPFLRQGHPAQSAGARASYTQAQLEALSHFLHEQFNDTLRSGPYSKVLNVLTGDPKAGAAYFEGEGGCKACHSPTGDFAGIATKYDPPTLQQRMLFPNTIGFSSGAVTMAKPVAITVTVSGEAPVSGTLEKIDDFDVSMRDDSGQYHSWKRTPELKIERRDPYAAHFELLDKYTDKDIHDLVAYLETLK